MDQLYQIGGFCFRLLADEGIAPPENFEKFAVSRGTPDCTYTLRLSRQLPEPEGNCIARRRDLMVYDREGLEARSMRFAGNPEPYAVYTEQSRDSVQVLVNPDALDMLAYDNVFASLFALERRMLQRSSMVLHCAYTLWQGCAILFSAPSETGKSTQAGLWEKYRGSSTVNGDRSLLRRKDGIWNACGWPVCGSSGICNLADTPIRAVVMLSQGKTDTIRRLSTIQAFAQVYSQITINGWSAAAVGQASGLIEDMVTRVPVFHLSCTISENAVNCLADALAQLDGSGETI